jgi:uncharacterized protein YhaN
MRNLVQQWQKYHNLTWDEQRVQSERQGLLAGSNPDDWRKQLQSLASERRALETDLERMGRVETTPHSPLLTPQVLESEIQSLRGQLEQAREERLRLEGQNSVLESGDDPDALHVELDALIARRDQLQRKAALYTQTKTLLEEAEKSFIENLQVHLVPYVSRYLRAITGDRYSEVQMDGKLNLHAYHPGRGDWLPAESDDFTWSAGTLDQLFFAARLGLLEALSGSHPVPLLLDDPFVYYDPARLQNVLQMLLDLSQETQIFLFTCREFPCHTANAHVVEMNLDGRGVVRMEEKESGKVRERESGRVR